MTSNEIPSVDVSARVCPECGRPAGTATFCLSCGRNLMMVERLPTHAEWDQYRPMQATDVQGFTSNAALESKKLPPQDQAQILDRFAAWLSDLAGWAIELKTLRPDAEQLEDRRKVEQDFAERLREWAADVALAPNDVAALEIRSEAAGHSTIRLHGSLPIDDQSVIEFACLATISGRRATILRSADDRPLVTARHADGATGQASAPNAVHRYKPCPQCAEEVEAGSEVCPYCDYRIVQPNPAESLRPSQGWSGFWAYLNADDYADSGWYQRWNQRRLRFLLVMVVVLVAVFVFTLVFHAVTGLWPAGNR
jgi:hypothetical protein